MQGQNIQLVNLRQLDTCPAQHLQPHCPACPSSCWSCTLTTTGQKPRHLVNAAAQRCKWPGGDPVLPTRHSSSYLYNNSSICYTSVCYQCYANYNCPVVLAITGSHLYVVEVGNASR